MLITLAGWRDSYIVIWQQHAPTSTELYCSQPTKLGTFNGGWQSHAEKYIDAMAMDSEFSTFWSANRRAGEKLSLSHEYWVVEKYIIWECVQYFENKDNVAYGHNRLTYAFSIFSIGLPLHFMLSECKYYTFIPSLLIYLYQKCWCYLIYSIFFSRAICCLCHQPTSQWYHQSNNWDQHFQTF